MSKAAFIHGPRDVRVGPLAGDSPGPDEVMLEVASVGICGSDLHYYKDGGIGAATIRTPFVPGHEFSGRLEADVEALGLTRGTLVAVDPARPCERCEWCRRGHRNLCPNVIFLGAPPRHGALRPRLAVPVHGLVPLPPGIGADAAAMLEPLGVCLHALDLARPALLERVALIGCGGIGLGILQLLGLAGVGEVHVLEPQAHRRELATRLGAASTGATLATLLEATDGLGCELVVEASNSPDGLALGVAAARIGGRVVLVGIPDGDAYSSFPAADARRRGLDLRFSRRMGDVYPRAIELVAQGRVDVETLISDRVSLDEVPEAFRRQADEAPGLIKTIVHPGR